MDWNQRLIDNIAAEAAEWFTRLRESAFSEQERGEFALWLLRSPQHIEEYLAVVRMWGDVDLVKDELALQELIARARAALPPENIVRFPAQSAAMQVEKGDAGSRRTAKRSYAVAAAIGLVLLASASWTGFNTWRSPSHFGTAIGEQRTASLPDGSVVNLNTNSELRVNMTPQERRLYLVKGEARFTVAKDASRPFIVSTSNATVRVLGTVFNVRSADGQTAIAVLEGRVEVGDTELAAGERATVLAQGKVLPNAGPPFERAANWPNRRLVFREETLASVVAEVNRYHRQPLRIADPQTAALRVSANFEAHDLASLIDYLQIYRDVQARPSDEGGMVLTKRR